MSMDALTHQASFLRLTSSTSNAVNCLNNVQNNRLFAAIRIKTHSPTCLFYFIFLSYFTVLVFCFCWFIAHKANISIKYFIHSFLPPHLYRKLTIFFKYGGQQENRMNEGWKFLKKLWCCVGGGNKVIWLYQLSWKCKLDTLTSYKLVTVANLHFQLTPKAQTWKKLSTDKVYCKHKKGVNLSVKVNVNCEEIKYVVSK